MQGGASFGEGVFVIFVDVGADFRGIRDDGVTQNAQFVAQVDLKLEGFDEAMLDHLAISRVAFADVIEKVRACDAIDIGGEVIFLNPLEEGVGGGPLDGIGFDQERQTGIGEENGEQFGGALGIGIFVCREH